MKKIVLLHFICLISLVMLNAQTDSTKVKTIFDKVCDGLKFPEGPAWDGKGSLYVSNCYGNWITRIHSGKVDTFASSPTQPFNFEKTNGLVVNKDGNIYACESGHGVILRFTPNGKCEVICNGYKGNKFSRPNDLAFDPKGNLYFTDPKSYDPKNLDGVVYMLPKGKNEAIPAYSGLGFPNGIAFSPDAKYAYVCESALQRILKFPVNKDGSFGNFTVFANLPGGDPDGIALDKKGNVYVAHFGGGAVYVFSSEGKQLRKITAPGKKPSNLEFAGKDMKTLYLTEDETNAVYLIKTEIPGMILFSSPSSR